MFLLLTFLVGSVHSLAPWTKLPCPRYSWPGAPGIFDVRNYGASGNGKTLDTKAFEKAIDAAHSAKAGGCVGVFSGEYLIGRISLKSNTFLYVDESARVLGSLDYHDYPKPHDFPAQGGWTVVASVNATNVGILGKGVIDGQSPKFIDHYDPKQNQLIPKEWDAYGLKSRPRLIQFIGSKEITILDITFLNSLFWTSHWLGCEDLWVQNVNITGSSQWPNNDGFDPESSRNIYFLDSFISTGDDALCPKAASGWGPLENLYADNVQLRSRSSAIKFGSSTYDHMTNCTFNNIHVLSETHRAIGIQARDKGNINNIRFTNFFINFTQFWPQTWWGAGEPIWVTSVHRTPKESLGVVSDIHFENITAYSENGVVVTGIRGHRINNVSFKNVNIHIRKLGNYTQPTVDYRPTSVKPDEITQPVDGWFVDDASVTIQECSVSFGNPRQKSWGKCLKAKDKASVIGQPGCENGAW